jgi:hypothetical protein
MGVKGSMSIVRGEESATHIFLIARVVEIEGKICGKEVINDQGRDGSYEHCEVLQNIVRYTKTL